MASDVALVSPVASMPMPTKQIAMEALYPQAVAEQWGTTKLAETAGVAQTTAMQFLARKVEQASALSDKVVLRLTGRAGAIFHDASMRNLQRLADLNKVPKSQWDKECDREEKHVLSALGPLMTWCKLRMDASPDDPASDPPQLSDGL